jgi:hypothetical protein
VPIILSHTTLWFDAGAETMGRINWSMAVCCCCCCCCIFVTQPTLCLAGFPRQFSPAAAFPSDAAFVHTEGGLLYAYFALTQLSHQRS